MIKRAHAGQPALITFTSDFHELVTGDLCPDNPVTLKYDPKRIIPKDEDYRFGDPKRPIIAHVQFGKGKPESSQALVSQIGIIENPVNDPTGHRFVLTARFDIPPDAEELIVWFSHLAQSGEMHYDSDEGANYRFGFASYDVTVLDATVVSDPQTPYSGFAVTVAADDKIEAVSVRYRVVSDTEFRDEKPLQKTGQHDDEGHSIWEVAGLTVPYQAMVRFKVFYWIGGQRYKDDNSGHYYLAPQPEPVKAPPPPPELARAAQAWK